jgi:PAS domain S-box-containing protein
VQPAGLPQYDITPISFTIMGLLIAFGIIRYRLFSELPVAYSALFHNMTDGVFVTDIQGEVIDLNSAALNVVGKPAGWIIGKPLSSILPEPGIEWDCRNTGNEVRHEVEISTDKQKKYYEIVKIPLVSDNSDIGCLVTLRDTTDRRNAQDALRTVNMKLNLLSDITRHDINNQLTVLLGYLHMVKQGCSEPEILAYIEKEERAASTISQQIQFTSQYQNIGMKAPVWQDIGKVFQESVHHHNSDEITIEDETGNLEVFADPLFEKVFYNLVDNSLRYGGAQMKTIRVSANERQEGLVITYEDNGMGIPDNEKIRIFKRGSGKTGGHGLFLVQEILSITGITISESGIPGTGARFDLIVPKGMYRMNQQTE